MKSQEPNHKKQIAAFGGDFGLLDIWNLK